jgi:hypothetical protein
LVQVHIASVTGVNLVLIVTEPTLSGLHDLERVTDLTRHFGVATMVCINKWDLNPDLAARIETKAHERGLTLAGRIRYDRGGDWESFQGTIHGGIVTTVLDEAMSKAIIAREWEAPTAELRVRFRGRVSPGERLHIQGWVIEKQRRRILTEATITTTAGEERAHAWATFLVPPKG